MFYFETNIPTIQEKKFVAKILNCHILGNQEIKGKLDKEKHLTLLRNEI